MPLGWSTKNRFKFTVMILNAIKVHAFSLLTIGVIESTKKEISISQS